jgi:hypothetical protein
VVAVQVKGLKVNNILLFVAMFLFMVSVLHASTTTTTATTTTIMPIAWHPNNNYYHWVNIQVRNWTYVQDIGGSIYPENKEKYVLVNFTSAMGDPAYFLIQGFRNTSKGYVFVGNITTIVVNRYNGGSTIMIPNTTKTGSTWDFVSVFYNPVQIPISTNYLSSFVITTRGDIGGNALTFGFNTSAMDTDWVVLASNSTFGERFNLTFLTDSYTKYTLFTTSNTYVLQSIGTPILSPTTLTTGLNLYSANANAIYGTTPTNFEAYFSILEPNNQPSLSGRGDQFLSEGMYANAYNGIIFGLSTNSIAHGIFCLFGCSSLSFNITTANSITFTVIPAFTRNYTVSEPYYNHYANSTYVCSGWGWYCDFQYRIPISNITWNANFTTHAMPKNVHGSGLGNASIVNFTHVGYMMLTLPYYTYMGKDCQQVYMRNNTANGTFDGGVLPYTLMSCDPSGAVFLVWNKTLGGIVNPKAFYVYINSTSEANGFSNVSIKNRWFIGSGSRFNVSYANAPFFVNFTVPVNFNSSIQFVPYESGYGGWDGSYIGYNAVTGREYYGTGNRFNPYSYGVTELYSDTLWVIGSPQHYVVSGAQSVFSDSETGIAGTFLFPLPPIPYYSMTFSNLTASVYDPTTISGAHGFPVNMMFNLTTPLVATVYHEFSQCSYFSSKSACTIGQAEQYVSQVKSCMTCNKTLNLTHTTTIGYTNSTIMLNVGGVAVNSLLAAIIVLISLFVLGFSIHANEGFGVIAGIVMLWVIGIWQIPLLVMAVIVTAIILVYEFSGVRKHG